MFTFPNQNIRNTKDKREGGQESENWPEKYEEKREICLEEEEEESQFVIVVVAACFDCEVRDDDDDDDDDRFCDCDRDGDHL